MPTNDCFTYCIKEICHCQENILSNNVNNNYILITFDDDTELISIYYGADVKEEDAEDLGAKIEALYPNCDVELQFGGQPIYYYIVSAE